MLRTIVSAFVVIIIIGFILSLGACQKDATSEVASQPAIVSYIIPKQSISIEVYQRKGLTNPANYSALIA
ncbi:hypothetical protein [Mucilaginibacter sp. CSA2-8R]|uniref:hypothetical protein n=1 Tax=Mucilaginibacter sp. CSA2-8R TaxID=3141542 RepID=UPI00315D3311